jgi:hypothetical protein
MPLREHSATYTIVERRLKENGPWQYQLSQVYYEPESPQRSNT